MSYDYTRLRATAERLLARFGQRVTLVKPGTPEGNPWNPTPGTPREHAITAVDDNRLRRDLSGTLIGGGAHGLIISTSAGVEPEPQDRVRMHGRDHEITEVKPLAPGGTVLLWEVIISE